VTEATVELETLDKVAQEIRYVITDMICNAGSGHIGGALSIVEIMITLYTRIMQIDPQHPKWEERDRFVLSKGHAGPVLYALLAYRGFFPAAWLPTLNKNETRLPSHVDQLKTPGVDITAGSLGQGLSCAAGVAYACKLNQKKNNVYCIIGDGESQEGQIWEAAMFAAHNSLDNLIVITDHNKMQIDDTVDQVVTIEPLIEKWQSFGWHVFEIDGHNWNELYTTFLEAIAIKEKPIMIIAHTIKGKGNLSCEGLVSSHNVKVFDEESRKKLICGIEGCNDLKLPY
jgi:transketolase